MLAVDSSNVTRCCLKLDGYTVQSISVHHLWCVEWAVCGVGGGGYRL